MAILQQQNDDKNDEKAGIQSLSQPAPAGGVSSGGTPSTQPYTAPQSSTSGRGSGRFTNIQKYLTANQGGGQQIQQGIENQANKQADQIRQGIASAQQNFNQTYQPEQQRLTGAQPLIQNTLQQAGTSQLTPDQIKQFQQLASGKGDYTQLSGLQNVPDASKLQAMSDMAGTEQGRFGLLSQAYQTPTYSHGQQKLDQLLFQLQRPQALQQSLQSLSGQVGNEQTAATQAATKQAADLQTLGQAAQTQATTGLTGAQSELEKAVTGRATQSQTESDELKNLMTKALSGGLNSPEEINRATQLAQKAGVNLNQKVYDLNTAFKPDQFLTPQQFTASNVATDPERAKAAALAQLAGGEQTFLAGQAPTTIPTLGGVVNQDALQKAITNRKDVYESALKPSQDTINNLTPLKTLAPQIWALQAQDRPELTNEQTTDFITGEQTGTHPGSMSHQQILDTERDLINKASKQGLSPDVANQLLNSDIMRGNSTGGNGQHAAIPKAGDILSNYFNQLSEAEKQVPIVQKQYGVGKTLQDLINRGINLPTQGQGATTKTPVATGPSGKIGLLNTGKITPLYSIGPAKPAPKVVTPPPKVVAPPPKASTLPAKPAPKAPAPSLDAWMKSLMGRQ